MKAKLVPASATARTTPQSHSLPQFLDLLRQMKVIRTVPTTQALLEDLFDGIDFADKRVLEIGGGDGVCSFYAAMKGAHEVVCLEPEAAGSTSGVSNTFVKIRDSVPSHRAVRLIPCTIQNFQDEERFDVILMNASINHIDEDACVNLRQDWKARETFERIFGNIASLAAPGGRLVISDCTPQNFFRALGVTNPLCPTIEWHKHQSPEVWAWLLEKAGFTHPKISWLPLYRLGRPGRLLTSNKAAAYFLKSMFRLVMDRA